MFLIASKNQSSIALAYASNISDTIVNLKCSQKPIYVKDNQIKFLDSYQKQVSQKIVEADQELLRISKSLSIPYDPKISLAYFHEGQDNWIIKPVYGGIVLEVPDKTIYTIKEIYLLKQIFQKTDQISLNGKYYQTNHSVKQLGPILHE